MRGGSAYYLDMLRSLKVLSVTPDFVSQLLLLKHQRPLIKSKYWQGARWRVNRSEQRCPCLAGSCVSRRSAAHALLNELLLPALLRTCGYLSQALGSPNII